VGERKREGERDKRERERERLRESNEEAIWCDFYVQ
jgi:hypothetical protein